MATDVEIRGKISVDSGNATKSTNELIDALKASKKALADAKVGSSEYKAAQENLKKATTELDQAVSKNGGSFTKLKETLGSTVPGFQGATQGASGLGKQLWLLVANPIVAVLALIVGGLVLLYKAFASTNDGADKLEQVMAGIGATIEVLRDRVLGVAKAIGKFFSGDFKGALEEGKKAVKGIGQEIADEFAAAAKATKTLQDLEDSMRAISIGRAELNRDLAKAKEIMSDSDASFAKRRQAINEVRIKEGKQNEIELAAAKANFENIKKQNELSDTSDEDLDRQAAAYVEYINLATSSANQLRALNKLENNLNKQMASEVDAEKKARIDAEKKAWDERLATIKKNAETERAILIQTQSDIADISAIDLDDKKKRDAEKDALSKNEIDRASFQAQLTANNYEVDKKLSEAAINQKRAQYSEVSAIIENAMQVFGKQTLAGKALAVAQALMNTYSGATDALRAKSSLPSPFDVVAKIANVALVIATGFKSIKAINEVQVPGGGGGSMPSMPSFSASAPLSPQQSSTSLNQGSIQGIGNAASGGVNRSFVLDADIKNNQERAARINRAARLG